MANPLTQQEDFNRWLAHPMTEAFRGFLRDYRDQLAMQWAKGQPMSEADQSRAEFANDLTEITCADVRSFYGLDEQTEGEQA